MKIYSVLALLATAGLSLADISISNPGFEIAPGGGTPTNLQQAAPEGWNLDITPSDQTVYYSAAKSEGTWSYALQTNAAISQTAAGTIAAETRYTISADFARNASSGSADWSIEAYVDGQALGSNTGTTTSKSFATRSLILEPAQLTEHIGKQLEIRLSRAGGDRWMSIDNVRISETVLEATLIANHSFEIAPGGGSPANLQEVAPEGWNLDVTPDATTVYYNVVQSDGSWSYAFNSVASISQETELDIAADTELTIKADFARNATGGTADFLIEALADGSIIDSVTAEIKHQEILTYALHLTSDQLAPHLGKKLTIRLGRAGGSAWMSVDNVRVESRAPSQTEIVIIGDSITQGNNNGKYSYRYELWKHLVDLGIDFDLVGSHDFTAGSTEADSVYAEYKGLTFDRDNEGHWNWDTDQVLRGYSESSLTSYSPNPQTGTETIDIWTKGYQADYALILLGRNDCNRNQGPAVFEANLSAIIDQLQADNPDVTIFLADILPNRSADETSYNAVLPGIATAKTNATSRVINVNITNGLNTATDLYDNNHPNTGGEAKVAQGWIDAISPYLVEQEVSITAADAAAAELSADPATLRVEIPFNHKETTITYNLSGSATLDTDYSLSATTFIIPANQTFVEITLTPISDAIAEGVETVGFTATESSGYSVEGSNISAILNIADLPADQAKVDYFGGSENATLPEAADDADWDGDGCTNLEEIALGTDPTNSTDIPQTSSEIIDPSLAFNYSISAEAMGLTSTPTYSTTLLDGSWVEMTEVNYLGTSDGFDHYQASIPDTGENTFFRLEISR